MNTGERSIVVKGTVVTVATRNEHDYIALSDMVRNFEGRALIEQWLKSEDTVLCLAVWEQLSNFGFNALEFEGIGNEAGRREKTSAIDVYATVGRYGGTYAHRDVASARGSAPSSHETVELSIHEERKQCR